MPDLAPAIAEACRLYGWTVEEVLKMEVKLFFRMIEEGRKLYVMERIDECFIQSISIQNAEGFNERVKWFQDRIPLTAEQMLRIHEEAEAKTVSGPKAKEAMTAFFKG